MDTFTTAQMLEALQSLHRTPRFFLDFFFPKVKLFDTEKVFFDVLDDNLTLAPFVSPVVAGKAEKNRGQVTESFTPAYVKPKNQITPNQVLARQPGEAMGGVMSAAQRRNLIITQTMADQRDRIVRRMEAMAAEFLRTGKIIVEGDDYPKREVDFLRTAAHTKQLAGAARWGEADVSPYSDVEGWIDLVGTAVGASANVAVFGATAWKYFKKDPLTKEALDRDYGQGNLIELGYNTGDPGTPTYKGRIGNLELYTYNGFYLDSAGATQYMIDPLGVVIGATGALAGHRLHGAILDGTAGYAPAEFWPKDWVENDPPVEFVMTQSAPLPVAGRPNATLYAKVR